MSLNLRDNQAKKSKVTALLTKINSLKFDQSKTLDKIRKDWKKKWQKKKQEKKEASIENNF